MQFLFPSFLWALALLAIPVIIHLFFFRRFKKVYFTNVKFLKELKEETSSRNKVKNLMVLLMRLLAIACLVFAFAQPFLPSEKDVQTGSKSVSIFIDNSFSMSALSEDVALIELAKRKATQIINAYGPEDKFQVLNNNFDAKSQRLISKEEALSMVEETAIGPAVKNLSSEVKRQAQAVRNQNIDHKINYLISDFQINITDLDQFQDSTVEVNLIPLQSIQEKNISIDSCWFDAPVPMLNQTNKLVVKMTNHSSETAENVRLSLDFQGQIKPLGSFDFKSNSSVIDTVNLSLLNPGWQNATLNITDYPIQFDDKYHFSFEVKESVKVLVINQSASNKYLNAAFDGLSYFELSKQNVNNIQYASFKDFDLIVLNDLNEISSGLASELLQYATNGGNVLTFPGANLKKQSYNDFLGLFNANQIQETVNEQLEVGSINTNDFIFKDVFLSLSNKNIKLPISKRNYTLSSFQNRVENRLLTYRNGSNFLSKYPKDYGNLFFCASPLDKQYNDLVINAEIFIPMIYKMAVSSGKKAKISYVIGEDRIIETENKVSEGDVIYKVKGQEEFIPGQYNLGSKILLDINDQVKESGFYNLALNDENLGNLAFNYNQTESDLKYYSVKELKDKFDESVEVIDNNLSANFTQIISDKDQGKILWRWFLIACLIFLAIEQMLLRFWKI